MSPGNRSRDATGRWLKGKSGNPGGRPAGCADLVNAARSEAPDSLRKLVWLRDNADSDAVRLAACREILDRAFGKPKRGLEMTGEVQTQVVIRHIFRPPNVEGSPSG